jgi:hypothetical protein
LFSGLNGDFPVVPGQLFVSPAENAGIHLFRLGPWGSSNKPRSSDADPHIFGTPEQGYVFYFCKYPANKTRCFHGKAPDISPKRAFSPPCENMGFI